MINLLTLLRIVLLLPLGWAMFALPATSWVPLIIFVVAGLTDFLDGFLARKLNQTSAFGAMLDQICDKIFIVSTLVFVVAQSGGMIALIVPIILIIIREFLVSGCREYAAQQGTPIPVDQFGKIKTVSQFIAITCMLCPNFVDFNADAPEALKLFQIAIIFCSLIGLWIAVILGWISAWRYMRSIKA